MNKEKKVFDKLFDSSAQLRTELENHLKKWPELPSHGMRDWATDADDMAEFYNEVTRWRDELERILAKYRV